MNYNENLKNISQEEHQLIFEAENKYGDWYKNTVNFLELTSNFIVEIKPDAWIFSIFLGQIRKNLDLAFLSALRKHHTQAMLDLRLVYEAGCLAAYAMAFPKSDIFVITKEGVAEEPPNLLSDSYKWIEKNYPAGSDPIKKLKAIINDTAAHSNLVYAHSSVNIDISNYKVEFNFFDEEHDRLIKTDLWQIGNATMGLMDLFYGVNKNHPLLIFHNDFISNLKTYEKDANVLKNKILNRT